MNTKIKALVIALALITTTGASVNTFMANAHSIKTDNAYVHGEITQISAEASGRITPAGSKPERLNPWPQRP